MQINVDFTQPALVHPQQHQWVASPQAGVERIMLDRTGAERGRATSIVRYAPDSRFPHHSTLRVKKFWCCRVCFPRATTITHRAGTCATRRARATPRTALRAP